MSLIFLSKTRIILHEWILIQSTISPLGWWFRAQMSEVEIFLLIMWQFFVLYQRRSHKLKSGGAQIQERCKTCNIKKLRCKTCNIKPLSKLNERTSNSAFKVDWHSSQVYHNQNLQYCSYLVEITNLDEIRNG